MNIPNLSQQKVFTIVNCHPVLITLPYLLCFDLLNVNGVRCRLRSEDCGGREAMNALSSSVKNGEGDSKKQATLDLICGK